jgi:hypothetical protein
MLVVSSTFATLQFTSNSLSLSLFPSKSLKGFKEFDTSCSFDPRTNPSELAAASKVGSSKVLKEEVYGLLPLLEEESWFLRAFNFIAFSNESWSEVVAFRLLALTGETDPPFNVLLSMPESGLGIKFAFHCAVLFGVTPL